MSQAIYRIMTQPVNTGDQQRAAWVARMLPGAEPTALKLGISPEAVVAQAALETGWGRAAIGNNIFGIKDHPNDSWHGKYQEVVTWEDSNGAAPGGEVQVVARFRDYDSLAESFADHFRFLEENGRYRAAGVFSRGGDEAYFAALQRAGYATDPAYAAKLGSILRTVKGYTAGMERVAVAAPAGYEVTATGNVINPNPAAGTIVKDARNGERLAQAAGAAGLAAPAVTSLAGMDWKLAAVFGVLLLGVAGLWFWNSSRIKDKRLEMARQGIV